MLKRFRNLLTLRFSLETVLIAIAVSTSAWAEINIPELTSPVIDQVGLLTAFETNELISKQKAALSVAQIQIWIIKTLENEPIENASIRAVEKWKLGKKDKDNGVLITVAFLDRRMRIEVGRGLEGDIPDVLAGRIIDQIMKPAFRNRQYSAGLNQAVDTLVKLAHGDKNALPRPQRRDSDSGDLFWFFLSIVLFFILPFIFQGRLRRGFGGGSGGSSWGGSGGRGGGGWSGGGGGFSGGGSSGGW